MLSRRRPAIELFLIFVCVFFVFPTILEKYLFIDIKRLSFDFSNSFFGQGKMFEDFALMQ